MSDSRIINNAPKTVLKSLHLLQNSKGNKLSLEALNLYSHLYATYQLFGRKFTIAHEQLGSVINCKKTKCYKIIAELVEFNLIHKFCDTAINGTRKMPNVLHLSLLPPPPFIFLRARIKATDFSQNLIPIDNVNPLGEDEEELILKHSLITLGNDHPYSDLLNELEKGDAIYFVAEPMQLEDGRWEIGKVFNLTTKLEGGN